MKLLGVLFSLTMLTAVAFACPEGYHPETRTDPCDHKENHPTCVRYENGSCVDWRDNWVCVPRSVTTCEHD